MKKYNLFFMSLLLASLIAYFTHPQMKKIPNHVTNQSENKWKTFEKKSASRIEAHPTTETELAKGNITRKIASVDKPQENLFYLREDRILTGENLEKYKDESVELPMLNKINTDWKEALGSELLQFQKDDTKIIVKDEQHIIKIKDNQGLYLEKVIITYFLKNGDQNSFHALVDSETGSIVDTWDRTIHEKLFKHSQRLEPTGTSNIIGR